MEKDNIVLALELFEKGTDKEHIGKLSEAIEFYREAFKLHSTVDKVYREKLTKQKQKEDDMKKLERRVRKKLIISKNVRLDKSQEKTTTDDSEKAGVVELEEPAEEDQKVEPCLLLEYLHDDVLVYLLKYMALHGFSPEWINLSLTCRKLANAGLESSDIWKSLCLQAYKTSYQSLQSNKRIGLLASDSYDGYRDMYFKKPFMMFGGVYISICTYLREGSSHETLSWTNPIHMITYYRYIRFSVTGRCMRLLTVAEPQDVIPKFTPDWQANGLKDVHMGFWSLEDDGTLIIEGEGSVENCQFTQILKVSNAGRRKHHQLKWVRSYFHNSEGAENEFSLKNEKWFTFSRVKSFSTHINF